MKRSDIKQMPQYFDRYINQVDDIELDVAFQQNLTTIAKFDIPLIESIAERSYAPGKWTVKDMFQHIIDTERVFAYRALRFARKDGITPQGYDQDLFASNANAGRRSLMAIAEEMKCVHQASQMLFRSFDASALNATGICWTEETSVLAAGFIIAGHFIHHMKVMNEKYIPLAAAAAVS
jgi:hypothetical protein